MIKFSSWLTARCLRITHAWTADIEDGTGLGDFSPGANVSVRKTEARRGVRVFSNVAGETSFGFEVSEPSKVKFRFNKRFISMLSSECVCDRDEEANERDN